MNDRTIELSINRPSRRHSTRFRAIVEVLDARRLMASGVTATTLVGASAVAGSPLQFEVPPTYDFFAPVGTPLPLVVLTSSAGSLSAAGYSATINWGDGSPIETATINSQADGTLVVIGSDHTYQTPGTFQPAVSVTAPGDSAPTVYHALATVSAPVVSITGQLNPLSDSGVSNTDGITNINTPNFFGMTQPGATVVVYASTNASRYTVRVPVGTGVADTAGRWSINTILLNDGEYLMSAEATGKFGVTASTALTDYLGDLKIDTVGPKITSFQVTDAKKGIFQVGFSDPLGLLVTPLTDPANYTANRPSPTPRRGQKFPVATLFRSVGSFGTGVPYGIDPVLVTGTLSTGKPLITRNGTYTFTIRSAGITSLSGASLDGEFAGQFPTGNGRAGGDFQVKVNVKNGKASGPIAIAPAKTTTHTVRARVAANHHA